MAERWIYNYGSGGGRSYKMPRVPREVLEDEYVLWVERLVRRHQLEQLRRLGFPPKSS